ncbi:MAG TPA: serine/threonine-protein kinase [Vicinamibacterales bacterium]
MPPLPTSIDRYQVLKRLGSGQMGVLYLGRDPEIGRLVAIKVLRDDVHDEQIRERFRREATIGRLIHQNIIMVFDVGEHEGQPFITMEYIDGAIVSQLIEERLAMPLELRLRLVEQLCSGLHYAHGFGIYHRDIKPENLMVDRRRTLKILDFGVAHIDVAGSKSEMTQAGDLMGTFNYMSPEQVVGHKTDFRCDIFAVGAVMYELLSFQKAFPGSLHDGLLQRVLRDPPVPLDQLVPDIDPVLVTIVNKALEKDREQRYQDLAAMEADVARVRVSASFLS